MFLCAQAMWRRVKCLIRSLQDDPQSSLKAGYVANLCSPINHFKMI